MKITITAILLFATYLICQAQTDPMSLARLSSQKLTERYKLSKDQQQKANFIEFRKYTALAEIAVLEKSNPALYRQKLRSIYSGSRHSFSMLLTSSQQDIFREQQRSHRKLKAKEVAAMKAAGASRAEIESAQNVLDEHSY